MNNWNWPKAVVTSIAILAIVSVLSTLKECYIDVARINHNVEVNK